MTGTRIFFVKGVQARRPEYRIRIWDKHARARARTHARTHTYIHTHKHTKQQYNTTDFIDIDSSGHSQMALEHFKTCFTEIHG